MWPAIRFNIYHWLLPTTLLFAGCNSGVENKQPASDGTLPGNNSVIQDSAYTDSITTDNDEYGTLYFTIVDTGQDYAPLNSKMYALQKELQWPIDTMNRYYNKQKKKIVVPDNDEDEMYRGEYFPRRFPSESMSLEYYKTYIDRSTETNIALVAGIYETRKSADSLLAVLRQHAPNSFVTEGRVFLGCMH